MKTIKLAATVIVAVWSVSVSVASAQQPQQNSPPKPVNMAEGKQANDPGQLTEVRPGVWVRGTPDKPIFAGTALIVPEAYDFVPRQDGGGR